MTKATRMNKVIKQPTAKIGISMAENNDASDIYSEYKGRQTDDPTPDSSHNDTKSDNTQEADSSLSESSMDSIKESQNDSYSNSSSGTMQTPPDSSFDSTESNDNLPQGNDEQRDRSVILIGIKPIMTYVTATLTQLANLPKITIKSRGKRITQAVDVSQMIVKRMNTVGFKISDIRINSDSFTGEDGRDRKISTMEIDITKI